MMKMDCSVIFKNIFLVFFFYCSCCSSADTPFHERLAGVNNCSSRIEIEGVEFCRINSLNWREMFYLKSALEKSGWRLSRESDLVKLKARGGLGYNDFLWVAPPDLRSLLYGWYYDTNTGGVIEFGSIFLTADALFARQVRL